MELESFLQALPEQTNKDIRVLLEKYVNPLSVLVNFILTSENLSRVSEDEFQTVVAAAKYDGVIDLMVKLQEHSETINR